MAGAQQLPIDKREIRVATENGAMDTFSVLDRRFMTQINFLTYNAFPIHEPAESAILVEWHQEIRIMCFDLQTLLCLEHDRFWAQLIHDVTLHKFISSFLQKCPRSWDIWDIGAAYLTDHNKLNRLVFLTVLRMSTDKESKECFMTSQGFGFTIYENYMFDVPKLIDICSIYGHPHGGNGELVNKMLTNVFTKQPNYVEDLKFAAQNLHDSIIPNIMEKYDGSQTTIGLYDLLCYHFDTCMSMLCLFSTYPPTLNYFNSNELITTFSSLYTHLFSDIKVKLKKLSTPTDDLKSFKSIINRCQIASVRLIHCVIWNSCFMDQLSDASLSEDDHTKCAEQFIAQLTLILGDVQLMTKYYHECNLSKSFASITNSKAAVGEDHFDYILNSIPVEQSPRKEVRDLDKVHYGDIPQMELPGKKTPTTSSAPDNINELISNVKEIFGPQYSDEFLQQCLAAYNFSSEEVIGALLEDNLPPHLETLKSQITAEAPGPSSSAQGPVPSDQRAPSPVQWPALSEPKTSSTSASSSSVQPSSFITSRANVFDGDEFDIFKNTENLDFDRIHMGKQEKKITKTEGDPTKKYLESNPKLTLEYDEYDDEYDDTYDGMAAAADGASGDFVIKPLNVRPAEWDEESGDESSDDGRHLLPRNQIERNTNRTNGEQDRGRGRGRGGRGTGPKPRAEDSKGQKADAKVLQQRRRDNANKAARGNHNRRAGADKKRRGGMLHI